MPLQESDLRPGMVVYTPPDLGETDTPPTTIEDIVPRMIAVPITLEGRQCFGLVWADNNEVWERNRVIVYQLKNRPAYATARDALAAAFDEERTWHDKYVAFFEQAEKLLSQ